MRKSLFNTKIKHRYNASSSHINIPKYRHYRVTCNGKCPIFQCKILSSKMNDKRCKKLFMISYYKHNTNPPLYNIDQFKFCTIARENIMMRRGGGGFSHLDVQSWGITVNINPKNSGVVYKVYLCICDLPQWRTATNGSIAFFALGCSHNRYKLCQGLLKKTKQPRKPNNVLLFNTTKCQQNSKNKSDFNTN